MLPEDGEVVRRQIKFFPTSTTMVNVERLPDARSLKTMTLRFREEPLSVEGAERQMASWVALFVTFGFLYSWFFVRLPSLIAFVRIEVDSVEGLPVVAAIIGLLLGLCAVLAIGFLAPGELRLAFVILSSAGLVAWIGGYSGRHLPFAAGLGLFLVWLWKRSVLRFHLEWLSTDPRVDLCPEAGRILASKTRWTCWSTYELFGESARALHRYVTYMSPLSGAAGVWVPASPTLVRLSSTFSMAAAIFTLVGIFAGNFLVAFLAASIILSVALVWVLGCLSNVTRAVESAFDSDQRSWWEPYVERLRRSQHVSKDKISGGPIREAEHLFLGFEPWKKFPILLHKPILHGHTYVVGRTGSGKTSIGMMQLLIQVLRGHAVAPPARGEVGDKWSPKSPVVIVDLKGDPVLFQTAKLEAEKRGQKFRFFTLEPGRASYRFNPFSGFGSATRTLPQLVQLVLDSLSLNHGSGYGRAYYSQRSRFMLSEALKSAKGVNSFKDLYRTLEVMYRDRKSDFRDAFELLSVIESLTHYDQLVTTKAQDKNREENTIQMDRVLEDGEVVYFWLPSAMESVTVREVGKLVLFNLRTAAQDRQSRGAEWRQAYLFIDECQKLAGENFQEVLQQARSGGIAAVLANQSLSDLKTPDCDLRPAIRTNTNVKMYFSMSDPEDIRTISDFSGQELQAAPEQAVEAVRPRLSADEILAISDHPQQLLLQVAGGSGYTQFGGLPIPVQTDWPISKTVADEREKMPWPTLTSAAAGVLVSSPAAPQLVDEKVKQTATKKYGQKVLGFMQD